MLPCKTNQNLIQQYPISLIYFLTLNVSPRLWRGERRVELCSPDLSTPPQAALTNRGADKIACITSHFVPVIQEILQINSAL